MNEILQSNNDEEEGLKLADEPTIQKEIINLREKYDNNHFKLAASLKFLWCHSKNETKPIIETKQLKVIKIIIEELNTVDIDHFKAQPWQDLLGLVIERRNREVVKTAIDGINQKVRAKFGN